MNYSNIAYAELDLHYDQDLFANEYDRCILPASRPISNGRPSWQGTRKLNQQWDMVDPGLYDLCDINVKNGVLHRGIPQWQMTQLMQLVLEEHDSNELKSMHQLGGTTLRNQLLHRTWELKPAFQDLEIVKWIQQLPITDIKSIHCVSIEPGQFASIHRDNRQTQSNTKHNAVYKQGFVVMTLNITNGGVPLYWALDGKDSQNCRHADASAYITSDYFLHGVPVVTSRRRQVRITARPNEQFERLLNKDTCVTIEAGYKFDDENWYPG